MGTTADEIVDLFMMSVEKDSTLNTIYTTSGSSALTNYAEAWLLKSIDAFGRVCTEDLTYTVGSGSSVGYFNVDLTSRSKNILSTVMIKFWLQQHVNNANAFGRYFKDREFSMSAPMLPSLREYLVVTIEDIDRLLAEYSWDKNADWANWNNQIFYEP
jgi:hypothetical protein